MGNKRISVISEDKGMTGVEYAVLLAFITMGLIAGLTSFSNGSETLYEAACRVLQKGAC